MGWITISVPGNPEETRRLQALLDEGKQGWEIELERKQGRPDLQADAAFDARREAEGHR